MASCKRLRDYSATQHFVGTLIGKCSA